MIPVPVKRGVPCLAALIGVVVPALGAQQLTFDLDSAKTRIEFVLSDVLHTVHGTFNLKEGHFFVDTANDSIGGDMVVDAASGNSGSGMRDKWMTRDILEAHRYPEIRFTPHKLEGSVSLSGTSNVRVAGSFLIHGQAHEINIPIQIQMSRDDVRATGRFSVPYVDWGMKNPSNFVLKVNDKVEINVTAIGRRNGLP